MDPSAEYRFTVYWDRHSRQLYRAAYVIVGNQYDAEDVVSEAVVGVLRLHWADKMADWNNYQITAYFYQAIRTQALNFISRRRSKSERDAKYLIARDRRSLGGEAFTLGPENFFASTEALENFMKLPERQREVLYWRVVEGYSQSETAQIMGVAEGTVSATKSDALVNLRRLMTNNNLEDEGGVA